MFIRMQGRRSFCRERTPSECPPQTGSRVTDARPPPLGASLQSELGIQNPAWGLGHLVPRATGQHRDPLQGWKPDAEAPARIKSRQELCPQDTDHRPGTRGARQGQPEQGHRGPHGHWGTGHLWSSRVNTTLPLSAKVTCDLASADRAALRNARCPLLENQNNSYNPVPALMKPGQTPFRL